MAGKRRAAGFYTDKEGRVRPITKSAGAKRVKRVRREWSPIRIPEKGRKHMATFTRRSAEMIYRQVKPHVGEQVLLYGGGGGKSHIVKLKAVEIKKPTYYAESVEKVPKGATNVKAYGKKTVTYEPKDDYIVEATLDGLGSKDSLFQEVERPAYIDKRGRYHPPKLKPRDFKPHLGSWRLAFRTPQPSA